MWGSAQSTGARGEQAVPCGGAGTTIQLRGGLFEAVLHPGSALSLPMYANRLDPSLLHGHWKEKGGPSEHKEDFRLGAISNLLPGDVVPPPQLHAKLREDPL